MRHGCDGRRAPIIIQQAAQHNPGKREFACTCLRKAAILKPWQSRRAQPAMGLKGLRATISGRKPCSSAANLAAARGTAACSAAMLLSLLGWSHPRCGRVCLDLSRWQCLQDSGDTQMSHVASSQPSVGDDSPCWLWVRWQPQALAWRLHAAAAPFINMPPAASSRHTPGAWYGTSQAGLNVCPCIHATARGP
jgi:hypothetical protein